jgi:2-methylcitrate dehydratase PrpD
VFQKRADRPHGCRHTQLSQVAAAVALGALRQLDDIHVGSKILALENNAQDGLSCRLVRQTNQDPAQTGGDRNQHES